MGGGGGSLGREFYLFTAEYSHLLDARALFLGTFVCVCDVDSCVLYITLLSPPHFYLSPKP